MSKIHWILQSNLIKEGKYLIFEVGELQKAFDTFHSKD
jgi:hypothetical protein